jgi:hypothetical protein
VEAAGARARPTALRHRRKPDHRDQLHRGRPHLECRQDTGQTIHGTFSSTYEIYSGAPKNMQAKWQYSVAGAGSWTDFAAAVTGSDASYVAAESEVTPGYIQCNQTRRPPTAPMTSAWSR